MSMVNSGEAVAQQESTPLAANPKTPLVDLRCSYQHKGGLSRAENVL
jgi:hypothetical protein